MCTMVASSRLTLPTPHCVQCQMLRAAERLHPKPQERVTSSSNSSTDNRSCVKVGRTHTGLNLFTLLQCDQLQTTTEILTPYQCISATDHH